MMDKWVRNLRVEDVRYGYGRAWTNGDNLEAHMSLLKRVREAGKGLIIMKVLAQGNAPADEIQEWIKWGFEYPYADSVDLGMNNEDEIEVAIRLSSPVPVA